MSFKNKFFALLLIMIPILVHAQVDEPPTITAQGRQAFCIGNPINIVTNFTITDPDDTTIDRFFIQISSGYQANFDVLEISGNHPNIRSSWNVTEGKLTLTSALSQSNMLLLDLENAVKDVVFTTSAIDVVTEKSFSLTVSNANYLPSTDHFYEFIDALNITWKAAKDAAENRFYLGRKGYLATLTSQEEANFVGKQAAGTGWIGASDQENEGEWKWVTGPEKGIVFWNGLSNGTSPNFAFWNNSEPNDFKEENPVGEDYAHITDENLEDVIIGSWNDLPNEGGIGLFTPRGYIVEYGGFSGEPQLNIAASTSIYIPQVIAVANTTICENENATLTAIPSEGEILWFSNADTSLNTPLFKGNTFTINNLLETTTYYTSVSVNGCITLPRTPVTAQVIKKPIIQNITDDLVCSGVATLTAQANNGDVFWYDSISSTTPIFIGKTFNTPPLNTTKNYFVEANNNVCDPSSRVVVTAKVDSRIPEFEVVEEELTLCTDVGFINLETTNPKGNYTYTWKKDAISLADNLPTITVKEQGIYMVSATSKAGCKSMEKTITVTVSEKANLTKENVIIIDDSENNSIEVIQNNLGIGVYEFALDDQFGTYQNESLFENLSVGNHTLYVRDKKGCETATFLFSIIAFPTFFSPNNDNKNDVWKITGYDSNSFIKSDIYIYNRFGMLLHKINPLTNTWDGKYQGKLLPPNTYWYKAILVDNNGIKIEKTGNFSLIIN